MSSSSYENRYTAGDNDAFREQLKKECAFESIRASGPGGQNVNKVNSKVRLRWNLDSSKLLSSRDKDRFRTLFPSRLTETGDIIITASASRSCEINGAATLLRLQQLIAQAKKKVIKRIKTRPTRSSIEKRLTGKKKLSQTKGQRARPDRE